MGSCRDLAPECPNSYTGIGFPLHQPNISHALKNPAGTRAFRDMDWAVSMSQREGLLTYQSSFGVAHIIASAIPNNYIGSKR